MLIITNVTYSKNPVLINEAFLISVTIEEQIGTWNDSSTQTWDIMNQNTWLEVELKDY